MKYIERQKRLFHYKILLSNIPEPSRMVSPLEPTVHFLKELDMKAQNQPQLLSNYHKAMSGAAHSINIINK